MMQVLTDGSWNRGTNRMGCAVMVLDKTGQWILGVSVGYGHWNTFLVEFLVVEAGLKHCWDLWLKNILCSSYCSGMVDVLQNQVDVRTFWARDTITGI